MDVFCPLTCECWGAPVHMKGGLQALLPVVVSTRPRDHVLRPDACSNLSCHCWALPALNIALNTLHVPVLHCTLPALLVDYTRWGVDNNMGRGRLMFCLCEAYSSY